MLCLVNCFTEQLDSFFFFVLSAELKKLENYLIIMLFKMFRCGAERVSAVRHHDAGCRMINAENHCPQIAAAVSR